MPMTIRPFNDGHAASVDHLWNARMKTGIVWAQSQGLTFLSRTLRRVGRALLWALSDQRKLRLKITVSIVTEFSKH